jgi:hypothetical protein
MNNADYTQLIQVIITIVVPLIIAAEAKWVTKIPSNMKPYVALALGQLGQVVSVWLTHHPFSPIAGLLTGAAGIGLREATITVRDHALTLLAPSSPPANITSVPPKPPTT